MYFTAFFKEVILGSQQVEIGVRAVGGGVGEEMEGYDMEEGRGLGGVA